MVHMPSSATQSLAFVPTLGTEAARQPSGSWWRDSCNFIQMQQFGAAGFFFCILHFRERIYRGRGILVSEGVGHQSCPKEQKSKRNVGRGLWSGATPSRTHLQRRDAETCGSRFGQPGRDPREVGSGAQIDARDQQDHQEAVGRNLFGARCRV